MKKIEDLIPSENINIYLDFYKRLTKIKLPKAGENVILDAFEIAGRIRETLNLI